MPPLHSQLPGQSPLTVQVMARQLPLASSQARQAPQLLPLHLQLPLARQTPPSPQKAPTFTPLGVQTPL